MHVVGVSIMMADSLEYLLNHVLNAQIIKQNSIKKSTKGELICFLTIMHFLQNTTPGLWLIIKSFLWIRLIY